MCAEMRRAQCGRLGSWQLNFWRDRTREADFLVHRGGRFHLADAKWTGQPRTRDAGSLRKVVAAVPGTVDSAAIVCRTPNAYTLDADVDALPLIGLPGPFVGD